MYISIAFLIGRIILGIYWLNVAYGHIVKSGGMIGYAQFKGVKSPKFAVIGTGVLALIGGLSILLGIWPCIGIIALVVFLLGVSFKMHAYWKVTDPQAKMIEKIGFHKNMALLGALLAMLAIAQPWVWSLGM